MAAIDELDGLLGTDAPADITARAIRDASSFVSEYMMGSGANLGPVPLTTTPLTLPFPVVGPSRGDITLVAGVFTIGNTGTYLIRGSASVSASTANELINAYVYLNGVQQDAGTSAKLGNTSDETVLSVQAIYDLTAGDTLEVKAFLDSGTTNFSATFAAFTLERLADSE